MTLDAAVARETGIREDAASRTVPKPQLQKPSNQHFLALRSISVALLLLIIANVGIQLNRRYFDLLSSGGPDVQLDLGKAQRCESFGRNPDVVFLGSSRAEEGTDTPLVDSLVTYQGRHTLSCNLAMSGSNFASDYFMLKRVVEDGLTPKLVVENLFEFNINANGNPDQYAPGDNHARWLADARDLTAMQPTFDAGVASTMESADFIAQKYIPLYGDRLGVLKSLCLGSTFGPCGDPQNGIPWANRDWAQRDQLHGWAPAGGTTLANVPADRQQELRDLIKYFRTVYLRKFKLIDHEPVYLTKLVELTQEHHIPLAFDVSPLHHMYLDLLPPSEWDAIHAYWQAFSDAHHVPLFDLSHTTNYFDGDFHDPHHLSIAGAEKFSHWVATTIVQPMLDGQLNE